MLVYSPGGGDSRTLGTTLAEDLASHGRVVVLVDHPGDASQVELPTGLRTTVLFGPPDPATFRTMVDTRIADLRLVLDRLGQPLLLFRTDGFDGTARIESSWAGLPGLRVLLPDSNHWAFTDYGTLVPRLQASGLVTATARNALVGTGDPAVTRAEVRRRVGTFFSRHLS
ncbi:hypothetical protein [Streptomyces sp. NPDC058157]|uniref:hypothetical protein n=1 Tax=Streptomyces sp. NPDC058157 TaxID=3346360 RepID=UPI0036EA588C